MLHLPQDPAFYTQPKAFGAIVRMACTGRAVHRGQIAPSIGAASCPDCARLVRTSAVKETETEVDAEVPSLEDLQAKFLTLMEQFAALGVVEACESHEVIERWVKTPVEDPVRDGTDLLCGSTGLDLRTWSHEDLDFIRSLVGFCAILGQVEAFSGAALVGARLLSVIHRLARAQHVKPLAVDEAPRKVPRKPRVPKPSAPSTG